MEENDDDEMKDFRLYISDDDEETSEAQKSAQPAQSPETQNGDGTAKDLENCESPEEWPVDDHDRFSDLYGCNAEKDVAAKNGTAEHEKIEILTKELPDVNDKLPPSQSSSPHVSTVGRSLPVSIRLSTPKLSDDPELNNNVEDIQPQFKELSLNSPISRLGRRSGLTDNGIGLKVVRFYVEATCAISPTNEPEILNMMCEPPPETSISVPSRFSDSSGNLGDISKTNSSTASSPITFIPPPPTHLARLSCASSSSSTSVPSSAAALAFQKSISASSRSITQARINQLNRKWKNSKLVYHILDYIDRATTDNIDPNTELPVTAEEEEDLLKNNLDVGQAATNVLDILEENGVSVTSRKRHVSEDEANTNIKRLRSTSPMPSTSHDDLLGAGVFAKWQNRKYYFAHVIEILDDGRLQVAFLDTTNRTLSRDLVFTELDLLIGHKVMVAENADTQDYYPGIVTSLFIDQETYKYTVLTNNGDYQAGVSQIYFTEHQAKLIRLGPNPVDVSSSDSFKTDASCSGIQKDRGSPFPKNEDGLDKLRHITGCDVETNHPQILNSSIKLKGVQGKLPKRSNKNEDTILGPLKHKGAWFKGMNFLLTCSSHVPSSNSNNSNEVHTDSEDYPFTTIPFIHDRLVQQIKLGGGRVFDKFEDIQASQYSFTFLVTNRPCLTPKYLRCIAAGLTILCHEWIVNCTVKQKRLSFQELPYGWSIEKTRFINSFDRNCSQPLSGLRMKIAQVMDANFFKFWSTICVSVGAIVSKFVGSFESTDIIIVENGLRDPLLDDATAFGIPVLSVAWIVQTIIHGKVRSFDAHETYNHLYDGSEDTEKYEDTVRPENVQAKEA